MSDDRESVHSLPTARVLREWATRSGLEYGSGALAHHFTLWLMQLGASPDLLRAGLDVVEDELRHAESCRALLAGFDAPPLPLLRQETLQLPRRADVPLGRDVLRACIQSFCLDETTAVRMFQAMRRGCRVPAVRELIDEFLADEVRHREFGWVTLEWLVRGPLASELRPHVEAEFSALVAGRRDYFGDAAAIAAAPLPRPEERAWGLLARGDYVDVFAQTVERDIVPRLSRLGLELR
ncbi:hypothetical protein SAMN02745121_02889 [Nannocystis exedens]|uniref:Ferritin-like domain-containing protein n=1 Tax=Nannocystis exedens TaxID=54 RepID=A0A1I1XNV8_9BACT|nr:ferritin-like domain-containing protein [Nannocystis exedens]PCC73382.1 hypothetical protein NAEX_06470 [Nannocystis exedens]SFE07210.1 hypothetical protein SAMN02745121_02889 [Nannocystis exedens]